MEEHLARLDESWKSIADADPNRQSDLIRIGQVLQQVRQPWNEVERDIERALGCWNWRRAAGSGPDAPGRRPLTSLQQFTQPEQDEWAQAARGLLAQRQPLVSAPRVERRISARLDEAEVLNGMSERFVKDFQFRPGARQLETSRLVEQFKALADGMERLEDHPYLNFDERIGSMLGKCGAGWGRRKHLTWPV